MSNHDRVALEPAPGQASRVFVVYGNCPSFRVCQNMSSVAPLCECCRAKKKGTKQKSHRREKSRDARVAPQSKVPWESLLTSEVSARAGNLKAERSTKAALTKRLREVILTQSREMEASEEVLKHLSEAL